LCIQSYISKSTRFRVSHNLDIECQLCLIISRSKSGTVKIISFPQQENCSLLTSNSALPHDQRFQVHDVLSSQRPCHRRPNEKEDPRQITSLTWDPTGTFLAVASHEPILRVFRTGCERGIPQVAPYLMEGSVHKVCTALTLRVSRQSLTIEQNSIFSIKFSPSGKYLLTASLDSTCALWDVKRKDLIRQLTLHQGVFHSNLIIKPHFKPFLSFKLE